MFGIRDIVYFFELDGESIDFFREENGMVSEASGESMVSAFECVKPLHLINELLTWKVKEDKHGGEQTS